MARILTVTANGLLDHLADAPVVPGRASRCSSFRAVAGGKGINVARVLVELGHEVLACGFAGGTNGAEFRRLVRSDGMQDQLTLCTAPLRIGFIAPGGGEAGSTALMEAGFAVTAQECRLCAERVQGLLPGVDLVICSGSVPDPNADGLYASIVAACVEAGVPCWVDSYGTPMQRALDAAALPTLAKPNEAEWQGGAGWERLGECHCSAGAGAVTVFIAGRPCYRVHPPQISERNAVASGDCYLAALADARLRSLDLPEQLRRAAAAGAANARRMDMAMITAAEIDALVPAVRVEELV